MMASMNVGFVINGERDGAVAAACDAAGVLDGSGIEVEVLDDAVLRNLPTDTRSALTGHATIVSEATFPGHADLVLSFGGDGTFLRAAHLCRDAGVALMGVNLGSLGFLAEIEIDAIRVALDTIIERSWIIERRMTLDVRLEDVNGSVRASDWALNEVSVEKQARQRLIRMNLRIGDEWFANVPADALVVATSTGSTAYALSAGGPIVSPRVQATMVVPVAPHSLFDRTLVVAADETVVIDLQPTDQAALVSCDGRDPMTLGTGDRVVVTGSSRDLLVARTRPNAFYELVRRKFRLR